jgi:hypothetical protein
VEGEFAHELTFGGKLDQLARMVRIKVDHVVVGCEQIAVGCERQADRPAEVRLILVDQGTRAVMRMRLARVLDGENLVIARGGNVESIVCRVVGQPARANVRSGRIRLKGVIDDDARKDDSGTSCITWSKFCAKDGRVQPRSRSRSGR